jgi:sortase B
MPAKKNTGRRGRRPAPSPLTSIVVVAVALLLFVVTVGLGVYLLMGDEAPVPSFPSSSEPALPPSSSASVSSSVSSSSQSVPESSKPSSEESTESASSQPASSGIPDKFDPAIMGSSGFYNIPNYQKINTDVKGWLNIPGTNINYPVLHDDRVFLNSAVPHFYLDKDIYKQQSRNAVIYADPAATFGTPSTLTRNTVLYGHNWTNVSANPRVGSSNDVMFAQLTAYHHLNFAKSHPYLYYSTADQEMSWVIFAAFYTDVNFNYIQPSPDDAGLTAIINGAKARSRHIFNVSVAASDKILTLSTCTRAYGKSDRQRFVVMARLMRPGETFVPVDITANPSPVLPAL